MPALALATAPPKVTLRSSPAVPYDGAIAAARTCYSPRVIERAEVTDKQRDSIGPLTFEGGHHTVFQHAHFEFGLENISRQLVWSDDPWGSLTAALKEATGRKGKALFHPLRLALTGRDSGPDMHALLPLIGETEARARLEAAAAR